MRAGRAVIAAAFAHIAIEVEMLFNLHHMLRGQLVLDPFSPQRLHS